MNISEIEPLIYSPRESKFGSFYRNGKFLYFNGVFPRDDNGQPILKWTRLKVENYKSVYYSGDYSMPGELKIEITPTTRVYWEEDDGYSLVYSGPLNMEHVSYALSHYPVKEVKASGNATIVIQAILDNANTHLSKNHGFTVATTTDMASTNDFSYTVGSARSALGGSEGSVLDVFGGEFEFDNYVIRLHKNRGSDTGVLVAYGKNLTDVTVTTSMESCYTHLFPYCLKDDELTTANRIAVTNSSGIAERVLIKDFTSFFEDDEEITSAAITTKANAWLKQNDINAPSVNISVSFIHLWQSPEYSNVAALEKVSLCDYVTVRHPQLAVDVKAQVTKTVYDVLSERYEKIELGSVKANFADTMKQATSKLQEAIRLMNKADNTSAITKAYTAAIDAATKAITGNSGGYVLLNPELNPQEILIMNTANKSTASIISVYQANPS